MDSPSKITCALLTTDARCQLGQLDQPEPNLATAPGALLAGFAACPEATVHVLSCTQQPVPAPAKLAENIFFHSLVVPKIGWLRTGYQGCIRAARKKLRELQPDIVHGQGTERDCALSAVFSGFPNVLTIHGNMQAIAEVYQARIGSFYWLAARLETFALRRTQGVFCNSAYTENLVAPRTSHAWRVANALQLLFFSPLPTPSKPAVPVLLNVGVAEPRKQQVELLAMARRLHERGCRFELQFAGAMGKTTYHAAFARELAAAEKSGYARHLGNLSTEQLVAVMDAASALVHFPKEEAFGLVVAEALARNLKFFGAATGGMVDIASGVEQAELIPADDFTALEGAIANWLQAGAPRPQNAASLMRQRYHPEAIARQHLEIYRQVLGKKFKR